MIKENDINVIRLTLIYKGFVSKKDIERFCKCGYPKACEIYNDIIIILRREGKKVSPLGIRTTRLLNYLEMTETDIFKYAYETLN